MVGNHDLFEWVCMACGKKSPWGPGWVWSPHFGLWCSSACQQAQMGRDRYSGKLPPGKYDEFGNVELRRQRQSFGRWKAALRGGKENA